MAEGFCERCARIVILQYGRCRTCRREIEPLDDGWVEQDKEDTLFRERKDG